MKAARVYLSSLLALAMSSQGGCAWWAKVQSPVPDVKPLRKARSAELVKEYEQFRDQAQYEAAVSAWNQGGTETCRELLDKLLERSPKHRGAQLLSVQLRLLEQELTEARAEADKLASEFPGDAEVLHVQGLTYEAAGEPARAAKCYRRALEIDPQNETYAASLAGIPEFSSPEACETPAAPGKVDRLSAALLRAEVHLALGETEEAQRVALAAQSQMSAQAELESILARIYQAAGNSAEAAQHRQLAAQLRGGRKVEPVRYDAINQPGSAHDGLKSPSNVKERERSLSPTVSTSALQLVPSVDSVQSASKRLPTSAEESLRRGEAALAADTPTAARRHFQQALSVHGEDENVAVAAAVAALRHDHPEMAAELAQTALRQWPKSAALYRVWGMAEYRRENCAAAQVALRQAISLDNSHALAYFLMGSTLSKLGQDEEAARNFRQAQQLDARYALKP